VTALRRGLAPGFLAATAALLVAPAGAVGVVGLLWMWVTALFAAAVLVGAVRRRPSGGTALLWRIATLLPRSERDLWRAEIVAVLHACDTDDERRRQVRGFLGAAPRTVLTSWRTRG
jgi:hypothetical protein